MIHNVNEQKKDHGENIKKEMDKPQREERNSSSKHLSREIIAQYFYMPITQAAKQLNIGLTLLKKRCRELGIRRWPHRKLASLETLIKNVHELSKDEREGAEQKLREAIEILEREKKLMEELPDMQLMEKTKRLRQACFKANYKKRKVMSMKNSSSLPYSTITQASPNNGCDNGVIDSSVDGEEIQSLLSDCFSSSNGMFLV
ncbi:hypothetical protein Leryth_014238 [Lithospermum erythrorhizon]|nr:hypothetical protein Leryth_014238 [Lithospermum erythrorhizon]